MQNVYETWDYESQGLSPAAAAVISLAVGMATYGTGSGFGAALTAELGLTGATALGVQSAIAAGYSTLYSQAAVSLINNGGDLSAVLNELGSSVTLRSLATSMITAGLTAGIGDSLGIATSAQQINSEALSATQRFVARVQGAALRATVSSATQVAINGAELDDALLQALQQSATSVIGAEIAEEIGSTFSQPTDGSFDPVNAALNKVAHTALGYATGAVTGDAEAGAIAGLTGSIAVDVYEFLTTDQLQRDLNALATEDQTGELTAAQQAIFDRWYDMGVDITRLTAGLSAAVAGADGAGVYTAADVAQNAAENNVLPALALVAQGAMVAYTAYEVYQTAKRVDALLTELSDPSLSDERFEEIVRTEAQNIALDLAIDVTLGRLGVAERLMEVGSKVLNRAGLGNRYESLQQQIADARGSSSAVNRAGPWFGIDSGSRGVGANISDDVAGWVAGPDGSSLPIRINAQGLPDWERYLRENASVTNSSGALDPSSVKFTQNSIGVNFGNGSSVNDLITGLRNGSIDPNSLPPIRTFEVNGQLFSLDNRRLYAYRQAGVDVPTTPATATEIARDSRFKFSTINGGQDIEVRSQ